MKPEAFFIVCRFKEDISWIEKYTDRYIIYNKGEPIYGNPKVINNVPNFGNDTGSYPKFIYDNYDNLPELMCFLQGNPFDHCSKEKFDRIIYNQTYTPITNYEGSGFAERQVYHNGYGVYMNYDNIMLSLFSDYHSCDDRVITFPPGCQMIVEKQKVLKYSKQFWQHLNLVINNFDPKRTELHGFERAMPEIVNALYKEKEFYFGYNQIKPKCFMVVSRCNENISWIDNYNFDYVIYNKGEPLDKKYNQVMLPNIGANQRDIFEFIYRNYENLPELMTFIQANPFDHCRKEVFDKLMYNESLTSFESYETNVVNEAHKKDVDGLYMERNNNWYINHHYINWGRGGENKIPCQYGSFDQFMNKYYSNYQHLEWIRFSPGSMYMIERKHALTYSKKFWKSMMDELPRSDMAEGHIIERAMFHILNNTYQVRDEYK